MDIWMDRWMGRWIEIERERYIDMGAVPRMKS